MKNYILSILLLATFSISIVACSKDEEGSASSYTTEQIATLKVLHGTFVSEPDIIGATTEFTFNETYLDNPRIATGTNVYGEKREYTIHGYCTYKYNYGSLCHDFFICCESY